MRVMRVIRVREKICLGKITFVLSSFSKIYNFCLGKILFLLRQND